MPPAVDGQPVRLLLHPHPEPAQLGGDGGQAVELLDPQLGGVADGRRPAGDGRGDGQHRHLVDQAGDHGPADVDRRAGRSTRRSRPPPARRPLRRSLRTVIDGPHLPQHVQQRRCAPGLTPTSRTVTRAWGWMQAATSQNAAEEMSPGTATSTARRLAASFDGQGQSRSARLGDARPLGPQQALGVVAAPFRLHDLRRPLGVEPGQQQAGLELGAGDAQLQARPPQRRGGDGQGQQRPLPAGVDAGPHLAQGLTRRAPWAGCAARRRR